MTHSLHTLLLYKHIAKTENEEKGKDTNEMITGIIDKKRKKNISLCVNKI